FTQADPYQAIHKMGRLADIGTQIKDAISLIIERYQITTTALRQHVLTTDAAPHAGLLLFLMLMVWYVLCMLTNLSMGYVLLTLYAWWNKVTKFTSAAYIVLFGYIVINLGITLVFLFEHLFLSR